MATSFVPLRLRSRYTRRGGTLRASDIGRRLAECGFGAGALRDVGNLYGAIEFYEGCVAAGVKPLIGADLVCPVSGSAIGLVALNREGYANLCLAISNASLRADHRLIELVAESSRGLGIIVPDAGEALSLAGRLGKERVWLEIIANRESRRAVRAKIEFAASHGIKALASWEVLGLEEAEGRISLVLEAIAEGKTIEQVATRAPSSSLAGAAALRDIFAEHPQVLSESRRLADMADLRLEIGTPHFPRLGDSIEESLAKLDAICREALPAKYPADREAASARLAEEMATIGGLGLADYFLVVADIVAFAAARGIPVAGRGSGASSIVAYLAGITQVDPIAEDLVFERFLNELRPDYPDIDIDISWKRRDEVIAHVYERFGAANVAMISTRACFELRLAAREVAKAFGLSPYEAQSLADRLPYHGSRDPEGAILRALGEIKPELGREQREEIARLARSIIGFPNHSSVHCGGVVVSDRPITYYTPLELAAKGIQVTQFDMRSIEKIGLVKIDLLGNRALSVIEEASSDIARLRGQTVDIKPDDPLTGTLLARGRTLSCFQLESPAMRNLLKMIKAATRTDATLALALVRPGPAAGGMKQEFVRRRRSGGPTGEVPPALIRDLPVFEEDVMRMIAEHTGVGLAEADLLRRSLKDSGPDDPALEAKFLFLAGTWGTSPANAAEAWSHIKRFANYTFSRAHAASFGGIAYTAAFLKAHFPLEFYAATLRNHAGMYPLWAHVNEARRIGLNVVPPSVNRSEADFAIEGDALRTGFASVKHLGHATIDATLKERRRARFRSLADFLARVPASRDEVIALVGSGGFDELEPSRSEILAEYLTSRGKLAGGDAPVLGLADCPRKLPVRAFTGMQLRRMEYEALGFSPLVHPLEFFDGGAAGDDQEAAGRARLVSTVRGLLAALRHYRDKGPGMWFASLDNPAGMHEIVIPDGLAVGHLEIGQAYAATGTAGERLGARTLKVRAIRRLGERSL